MRPIWMQIFIAIHELGWMNPIPWNAMYWIRAYMLWNEFKMMKINGKTIK
jgi:hypothetical protein